MKARQRGTTAVLCRHCKTDLLKHDKVDVNRQDSLSSQFETFEVDCP